MASSGDVVGKIKKRRKEIGKYVEWEIDNFFSSVPDTIDFLIKSPDFYFANRTWNLQLEPNGYADDITIGCITIYLFLKNNPKDENVLIDFTLGIKSDDSNDQTCSDSDSYLYKREEDSKFLIFIMRNELYQRRQKLVPGDTLTVFCRVNIASQKEDGISTLSEDFKNLFIDEKDYDATISVKDKSFHVHKVILGSRSPVLSAMFQHEMKEKSSNTVNIDDCDPEIFHEFLLCVYSGKTENLSPDNAVLLYNLADKYIFKELKQICSEFLEVNMNLDNICEIVILADRHNETQLMETAYEWVKNNLKAIIRTDQWATLVAQNSVLTVELLKQALPI